MVGHGPRPRQPPGRAATGLRSRRGDPPDGAAGGGPPGAALVLRGHRRRDRPPVRRHHRVVRHAPGAHPARHRQPVGHDRRGQDRPDPAAGEGPRPAGPLRRDRAVERRHHHLAHVGGVPPHRVGGAGGPAHPAAVRRDPAVQHPRHRRQAPGRHEVQRLLGAAERRPPHPPGAGGHQLPAGLDGAVGQGAAAAPGPGRRPVGQRHDRGVGGPQPQAGLRGGRRAGRPVGDERGAGGGADAGRPPVEADLRADRLLQVPDRDQRQPRRGVHHGRRVGRGRHRPRHLPRLHLQDHDRRREAGPGAAVQAGAGGPLRQHPPDLHQPPAARLRGADRPGDQPGVPHRRGDVRHLGGGVAGRQRPHLPQRRVPGPGGAPGVLLGGRRAGVEPGQAAVRRHPGRAPPDHDRLRRGHPGAGGHRGADHGEAALLGPGRPDPQRDGGRQGGQRGRARGRPRRGLRLPVRPGPAAAHGPGGVELRRRVHLPPPDLRDGGQPAGPGAGAAGRRAGRGAGVRGRRRPRWAATPTGSGPPSW